MVFGKHLIIDASECNENKIKDFIIQIYDNNVLVKFQLLIEKGLKFFNDDLLKLMEEALDLYVYKKKLYRTYWNKSDLFR